MSSISANTLKTRGVSALSGALKTQPEVTVSVRGKDRYVVMDMARYQYLRECELAAALAESRAALAEGDTITESVDEHLARITDEP